MKIAGLPDDTRPAKWAGCSGVFRRLADFLLEFEDPLVLVATEEKTDTAYRGVLGDGNMGDDAPDVNGAAFQGNGDLVQALPHDELGTAGVEDEAHAVVTDVVDPEGMAFEGDEGGFQLADSPALALIARVGHGFAP